jgi:DNA polymerase II large subunit
MKCDICNKKIEKNFLDKIFGTYIKNSKNKQKVVCNECQSKLSKEEIIEKIN